MSNIILYTNPQSRGRIVRWMLEEIGQAYDIRMMEFGDNIKSSEYRKLNPMGKVPTLVHEDTVITEVAAICAYLADRFPEKELAPAPDSAARGSYYRWMFFVAGPLEMAMTARAYQWPIDDSNAQAVGCGHIEDTVSTLEQALAAGPYLCGDRFTTADLLMASYVGWEIMMKNLEPKAVFTDYLKPIEERPAAKRANELDDALIPRESA